MTPRPPPTHSYSLKSQKKTFFGPLPLMQNIEWTATFQAGHQDGYNLISTHLVVVVDQGLEGENDSQVLLLVPHHHGMAGQ